MDALPVETLDGTPRELGRRHGEGRREAVRDHLELALSSATHAGGSRADVRVRALAYRPAVQAVAPWLDQEIIGVAEGAAIAPGDAYLLQLRAELDTTSAIHATAGECTTFSAGGRAGQNVDLPEAFAPLMSVRRIAPSERPGVVMVAAAGQVSHVGLNDAGLAVFASFLACGGWRVGFPRYLLTRLALAERHLAVALARVAAVRRAAPRALLLAAADGEARVAELTPTRMATLAPGDDGVLVHANHFEADELREEEQAPADWLADSHARAERMRALLSSGTPPEDALRDRATLPFPISRERADGQEDFATVVSAVADPAARVLRVAPGAPHRSTYASYPVAA